MLFLTQLILIGCMMIENKHKREAECVKSKYETHVEPRLTEVEAWCSEGISEKKIAKKLGISYASFKNYKKEHLALLATITRARAYVDDIEVVPAYLRKVTGYDVTETKREYIYVKNEETGTYEKVLFKETEQERHIPPDPRAAEFWLTNRQPEKWKRQPENGLSESESTGGMIEIPAVISEN